MTEDEMNEEVERQVALLTKAQEPLMTQIAVTQAVVAALVADHPDPAALRARAEGLLMQAQGRIAMTDEQLPRLLPDPMRTALDYLFRPVLHLGPE